MPNQLQRMYGEDLLQAVFPDAAACQDNIQGAREIPDHPLVNQALKDALEEAVDAPRLERQLQRLHAGEIRARVGSAPPAQPDWDWQTYGQYLDRLAAGRPSLNVVPLDAPSEARDHLRTHRDYQPDYAYLPSGVIEFNTINIEYPSTLEQE